MVQTRFSMMGPQSVADPGRLKKITICGSICLCLAICPYALPPLILWNLVLLDPPTLGLVGANTAIPQVWAICSSPDPAP
jgi:hypothetical protein